MEVKEIDLCTDCVQIITNPICPNCFSRQVLQWLDEKKLPYYKKSIIRKKLKEFVVNAEETPSEIRCIICSSKKVNICNYCFNLRADEIISKHTSPSITDEFNDLFNSEIITVHHIP